MALFPITLTYQTASTFVPAAPIQRQFIIDTTNPTYFRNATLTQDTLYLTIGTSSVIISLSNLYSASISTLSALTWPPLIITQPTSSTSVHPTGSYFLLSASAETAISYQWFISTNAGSTYYQMPTTASISGSSFTGSLTTALTCSVSNTGSYSLYCTATNLRGSTNSNIINYIVT